MLSFPRPILELIQLAEREDLAGDDVTSRLLISEDQVGVGTLIENPLALPAACR